MRKLVSGLIVAAATAAIAVPLALAGGNSDAAKACQQGGWQNLVRQDGTGFTNTGDCVSYAAQGGVLSTRSTAGSENFSQYASGAQPTTFSGGTIAPADYAPGAPTPNGIGGSILVSGPYFNGFASDTHFLFTGWYVNSAKLTFTNPVKSVQVEAQSNKTDIATHLTLTGYDASGNPVPGATATGFDAGTNSVVLKITSPTPNIKSFTIATDDPNNGGLSYGLGFSNIVWS
jgi:hypothetical protein